MFVRLGAILAVALILGLAWKPIAEIFRRTARARPVRPRRRERRPGDYRFEQRTKQLTRQLKGVPRAQEDREAILAFIESRQGVEAYVEPRTVMHPLSAVLVAADGEWRRFELADDSYIRELARTRGLKVFDAGLIGYPQRMRDYRRPKDDEGPPPQC